MQYSHFELDLWHCIGKSTEIFNEEQWYDRYAIFRVDGKVLNERGTLAIAGCDPYAFVDLLDPETGKWNEVLF